MMRELFPDTTYGVDSGGDPDHITDLTYEEFQEFYRVIIIRPIVISSFMVI